MPTSVVQLILDHTKNQPEGALPVALHFNPRRGPFCFVAEAAAYARQVCAGRPRGEKLFRGARYEVLRDVLREVATACGLNPARVLVRGFRSGCCMATSPDAFADPAAVAAKVQQAYQGWADGGQRPYAKGLMGLGRVKSLDLYDPTINTVNDAVTRYMRFAEAAAPP
jgi:hypothetical protein